MRVKSCSYSSDKRLSRCEKQFSYRYDEQLVPKTKKLGLFRGDWYHQLLEAYYSQEGWIKRYKLLKKNWNKLFDEEKEYYGINMPVEIKENMQHYQEHWEPWDKNWKIILVEQSFELMTKFGFPVRWKADLIVEENGVLTLVETKAKKKIPDSSERILQPQVHGYAYLLSKKGYKIDKIIWNYFRTEPVPRPKILKNGGLSSRDINTDKRSYLKSIREAGLWPKTDQEWEELNERIKNLPETLQLERVTNSVNLELGKRWVGDWIERHRRAQGIERPLLSYNRNCKWDCDYYDLCQTDLVNKVDRNLVILKGFEKNVNKPEPLK